MIPEEGTAEPATAHLHEAGNEPASSNAWPLVFFGAAAVCVTLGFVFAFHYDPGTVEDPGFGQVVNNDQGNLIIGAIRGVAFMCAGIVFSLFSLITLDR